LPYSRAARSGALASCLLALAAAAPAASQAIAPFLPSSQRSRAEGLLAIVESSSARIAERREAAYAALCQAEADCVPAYAAAMADAASGGAERWSIPGGRLMAGGAAEGFAAARKKARESALALALDGRGLSPDASADREAAAAKLSSLIALSPRDAPSQAGLIRTLQARSKRLAALFPETAEIAGELGKSAEGRAIWIDALARLGPEPIARRLRERAGEAAHAAPNAARALGSLDAALLAYDSLSNALPKTLHPATLIDLGPEERRDAKEALRAFIALSETRARALLAAMGTGDGRERAAAEGARRFASFYRLVGRERAGHAAKLLELPASSLDRFAWLVLGPAGQAREGGGPAAATLRDEARALDLVHAALAQREAAEAEAGAKAGAPIPKPGLPDPLLPLLAKPELMELAYQEPRYARFLLRVGPRLGALYELADAAACAQLSAQAQTISALAAALGASPQSLAVRVETLRSGDPGAARLVCFVARARSPDGQVAAVPIGARNAAAAYGPAFRAAFGLASPPLSEVPKAPAAKVPASKASASRAPAAASKAAPPEEDLSMYGQRIVSACLAPDGRAAIIESYPAGWAMTAEELEGLLFAGELP